MRIVRGMGGGLVMMMEEMMGGSKVVEEGVGGGGVTKQGAVGDLPRKWREGEGWLTKWVGGPYGEDALEACEDEDELVVAELGELGLHLEVVDDAFGEEEEDDGVGGQGRSPRDHLGYERNPLISSSHMNKKLPSSINS